MSNASHPFAATASPAPPPAPTTSLFGRDGELAVVRDHLLRPDVRLLALTGPPGVGKTRLVLEAAREATRQSDGTVFFVSLAERTTTDGAAIGILQSLELPVEGGVRALRDFLRARRCLLVLDNVEQIADVGLLCAELLAWAPDLKILVTSRIALRVSGEHELQVAPLTVPEERSHVPAALAENASAALFRARARAVSPSFEITSDNAPAVAEICRRIEGIPLAIELAAARIKYFPVSTLLARLDDRLETLRGGARDMPARQRTLDAAISWSFELLPPEQRQFFSRLAVFAGGCTAAAAATVCGADSDDSFEALEALVDHSLIRRLEDGGRFAMLETLRDYARRRLDADPGSRREIAHRHALYFLGVARRAAGELRGPNAREGLAALDADRENLRVASRWALDARDANVSLGLCAALGDYWRLRGMLTEGRTTTERALAIAGDSSADRARALCTAGALARLQSDLPSARRSLDEAVRVAAAIDEPRIRAEALSELALTLVSLDELDAAEEVLADAWRLCESHGADWERLLALHARARLASIRGDLKLARQIRAEAVELAVNTGNLEWEARARVGLGDVARLQRDYIGAREQFKRALSLYREIRNSIHLALGLRKLGHIALHLGDVSASRASLLESFALFKQAEQRSGMSACAVGLGCVLSAQGNSVSAVRFFGASGMAFADDTGLLQPADVRDRDEALARCRTRLGDTGFQEALDQGRVTPLEELLEAAGSPTSQTVAHAPLHATLTPRELDVLRFLPQGLTYAEIGEALFISARTVDAHLRAIYAKLNVRSRHEAAGYALQHGLTSGAG